MFVVKGQLKLGGGGGGWEEKLRIRLNSAQLKLKLLVGAELGNNIPSQKS